MIKISLLILESEETDTLGIVEGFLIDLSIDVTVICTLHIFSHSVLSLNFSFSLTLAFSLKQ